MCSLQQLQFVGLRAWRTQQLQLPSSKSGSLVVLAHMLSCPASYGSSQTRDQTHVPCIGRPTPDQQNYHESLVFLIIYLFSTLRSSNFLFILNLLVNQEDSCVQQYLLSRQYGAVIQRGEGCCLLRSSQLQESTLENNYMIWSRYFIFIFLTIVTTLVLLSLSLGIELPQRQINPLLKCFLFLALKILLLLFKNLKLVRFKAKFFSWSALLPSSPSLTHTLPCTHP